MKTHLFLIIAFVLLTGSLSAQDNKASVSLSAAIYEEEVTGNLDKAVELYLDILKKYPDDRPVAAKTLYHLGLVNEKMGKQKANEYFTRLVNTYPDQIEVVALAKARLAALGGSGGAGGPVTRQVIKDASGVSGILTPDGKYISKIDRNTGDMILFELSSGQTSRITNKGPVNEKGDVYELPVYSRDGKQIAYCSYTKENDWGPQLRIRSLDGSGLRTLYSDKGVEDVMPVDWSSDGGYILELCSRNKSAAVRQIELTLISTAGGSVRVLKSFSSPMFWFQNACFSPDGKYVAFSYVCEGNPPHGEIFIMTTDGRNEVVIAGHPAEDRLLRWTPDGKSILFISDRSGTSDIWSVHIAEGKQQGEPDLLKKNFGWDSEIIGFTPKGTLYYKTRTSFGGLYSGEVDLETGKVLLPPALVTTRYTGPPSMPTWSPDGRNLAYILRRGSIGPGNNILTIRSAATGEDRILSSHLRYVNQISWAPDSRSIIALGITETQTGIFRIDAQTSEITRLADLGLLPNLCPDGKTLVFINGDADKLSIRKRDLNTGEVSEVVKVGRMYYDLSPDGHEVVFQVDSVIKAVSINGGEPRELFRGPAQYYWLRFTRDGHYIIAQTLGATSGEIWRVPAQGGSPMKLDLSVPKIIGDCGCFTLHPDNRRFAYSVNEGSKEELWVLENFLPK